MRAKLRVNTSPSPMYNARLLSSPALIMRAVSRKAVPRDSVSCCSILSAEAAFHMPIKTGERAALMGFVQPLNERPRRPLIRSPEI